MKIFIPLIIVVALIVMFLYVKISDVRGKSKINGVSDEVYEQLVQHYFYTTTFMEMFLDKKEGGDKVSAQWIEEHELYEEAEAYAKENHFHALEVFPNPLLIMYTKHPDDYNETEQIYIEKIKGFVRASQMFHVEDYEVLKQELKKDLHIKDADNPFD